MTFVYTPGQPLLPQDMQLAGGSSGGGCRALFVKGLSKQCSERHLSTLFAQFGTCHCQIARHRSGRSAGFAIVTFQRHEQARLAMGAADNGVFLGRRLSVRWFQPERANEGPKAGANPLAQGLQGLAHDQLLALAALLDPSLANATATANPVLDTTFLPGNASGVEQPTADLDLQQPWSELLVNSWLNGLDLGESNAATAARSSMEGPSAPVATVKPVPAQQAPRRSFDSETNRNFSAFAMLDCLDLSDLAEVTTSNSGPASSTSTSTTGIMGFASDEPEVPGSTAAAPSNDLTKSRLATKWLAHANSTGAVSARSLGAESPRSDNAEAPMLQQRSSTHSADGHVFATITTNNTTSGERKQSSSPSAAAATTQPSIDTFPAQLLPSVPSGGRPTLMSDPGALPSHLASTPATAAALLMMKQQAMQVQARRSSRPAGTVQAAAPLGAMPRSAPSTAGGLDPIMTAAQVQSCVMGQQHLMRAVSQYQAAVNQLVSARKQVLAAVNVVGSTGGMQPQALLQPPPLPNGQGVPGFTPASSLGMASSPPDLSMLLALQGQLF